jgi:hypothetical protein
MALWHFQINRVRKYEAVAKSRTTFSPSISLFFHIIAATICLFGLLLILAMVQADGTTAGQVADNGTGEFIYDTSIPVSEASIQQSIGIGNTHADSDGNSTAPEATVTGEAAQNIIQGADVQNEYGLDNQQGSHHEYNEDSASHVEYRHVVHYVDREVVKEVLVEKPVEFRQFNSLEELEAWLAEDDTNEYVYLFAGKDGVCRPSDKYDCDDYALQLQLRAANSGFLISVTVIKEQGKPHMINLACIGNNIYYIEPQSDKVWFYCRRD